MNEQNQEQSNRLLTVALYFRLSAEDKRRLQILADFEHCSISELLRNLINEKWAQTIPSIKEASEWLDRAKIIDLDQKTYEIIERWFSNRIKNIDQQEE